jgi:OmpA-OmpF porin, OOP family
MRSLALLFLLMPVLGWSQNLVPNPSFEEYEECPISFGELEQCTTNWKSWQESPDYYNACNNNINGNLGVPQNNAGYQEPIIGNAYAGIYTYSNYGQNVREYAATALQSPLIVGQSYYVMFYVSDVEGEGDNFPGEYKCSTNHLGLRFF